MLLKNFMSTSLENILVEYRFFKSFLSLINCKLSLKFKTLSGGIWNFVLKYEVLVTSS